MDFDSPWGDEAADLNVARENEWSKLASNFTNAGYREGINAGKEAALQEGFNAGFAQVGAPLGRELGMLRGIASALIYFLSSSKNPPSVIESSSLIEAKDIAAQLTKVRFSDIAPPDLEAEAHAKEHFSSEDDAAEVDMPEEVVEKRKMEKLEDMLEGMSASSDGASIARPTVDDVRILKERLYGLCSSIGEKQRGKISLPFITLVMQGDETLQKQGFDSDSESEDEVPTEAIPNIDIDVTKLTPLSPEVISKQATINLGTIGHVAHGKSTVVKAISGVQTVRFKNELVRNITIKLGYANAKIYKCENETCPRPGCYRSYRSDKEDNPPCERPGCGHRMKLVRHVSFVDCPGHDILMATMLNGAAVMDAALLLIAGNETCPQPQTSEHLAAVEIMKLQHIIILQNKVDLIKEAQALEHQKSIAAFVKGTVAESSPIVPISAQLKYNIDAVNEYIVKRIPIPIRDFSSDPKLIVIRSFDVNKPGAEVEELKGGVAGGSILTGVLRLGQEIEIRPGIVTKDTAGRTKCQPIFSRIMSLHAENNLLSFAVPGGLIGVGTKIDPTLCRADRLVGQVLGAVGKLPQIYTELEISLFLLRRLLGVKTEDKKQTKVSKLVKNELLLINIGSTSTGGRVLSVKGDLAKIQLTSPACTQINEKVALSRRIEKHWRLVGWGSVKAGTVLELD